MAASCDQTIKITGGAGATSVQSVTYDPKTNTITITKANGATNTLPLVDEQLMTVTSDSAGQIKFTVNDSRGRGTSRDIIFDGSKFLNVTPDYTQTDATKMDYIKHKPSDLVRDLTLDRKTFILKWEDELGKTHSLDFKDAFKGCPHVVSGYLDLPAKELVLVTFDPQNPCAGTKGNIHIDLSSLFKTFISKDDIKYLDVRSVANQSSFAFVHNTKATDVYLDGILANPWTYALDGKTIVFKVPLHANTWVAAKSIG